MSAEVSRAGASSGVRASHADRDRVVDVLTAAAGDGRLTAEELEERVEAALTARTMGELAVLTGDLPVVTEAKDLVRIQQEGGSVVREGEWAVPRLLEIESSWGDVTLDFTDAVISQGTVRVDLDMQGGTLRLVTRPGVVVDTVSLVTNYAQIKTQRPAEPDVPVMLRVEVCGRLSYGRVLTRSARRGWWRR
ncbi:DUF1707 domain-containing protein [Streptomyces sp. NPDC052023]|uniref:DUF1707 domain-containing protein n=1 Tax=Streptomyces sp. NPDC052023 TaxID=3365681 RepID=UPI0037D700BB